MERRTSLHSIPDEELLRRLADLLRQSRHNEADLVAHIGEVDERRLYAREACPFDVRLLHGGPSPVRGRGLPADHGGPRVPGASRPPGHAGGRPPSPDRHRQAGPASHSGECRRPSCAKPPIGPSGRSSSWLPRWLLGPTRRHRSAGCPSGPALPRGRAGALVSRSAASTGPRSLRLARASGSRLRRSRTASGPSRLSVLRPPHRRRSWSLSPPGGTRCSSRPVRGSTRSWSGYRASCGLASPMAIWPRSSRRPSRRSWNAWKRSALP